MLATAVSFATFSAQISTEVFETETNTSNNFTDNGVVFNIVSTVGRFRIQTLYPSTGWNGTAVDNRYIDNDLNVATNASFSIKTTSNLFKTNRFWVFLGGDDANQNVTGTLTVTGKLYGVTKFTAVKSSDFTNNTGIFNGFTLIDLTNFNGQNYSNIIIDELQLTTGGNFSYLALDAFTWVKDAAIVLGTSEKTKNDSLSVVFDSSSKQLSVFNSKEIKKALNSTKIDATELTKGTYIAKVKTKSESVSTKFIVK